MPRSCVVDPELSQRVDRERAQLRAVRIGEADVRRDRAVVERVLAPGRAVDELIGDDEIAGLHVRLAASRTRVGPMMRVTPSSFIAQAFAR